MENEVSDNPTEVLPEGLHECDIVDVQLKIWEVSPWVYIQLKVIGREQKLILFRGFNTMPEWMFIKTTNPIVTIKIRYHQINGRLLYGLTLIKIGNRPA